MNITERTIRELRSEADTASRKQLDMQIDRTQYHERRIAETVEARKATGDVTIFVNEFHRWSRKNPPTPDERTWLGTAEVMELQWYRYRRSVLNVAIQCRFGRED